MSKGSKSRSGGGNEKVFAGRYAYKKPLGRGAGGSVYLAEDLHFDRREVALKVLSEEACGTVQGKMLRREFEILSKLDHPNLVHVYDYGALPDGGVYLAEEYIDGFSLQDARALLEPEALIDPTLQVLQGLAYLHGMGTIHRDIKPANVMLLWLDDASARPMIKLVDFGLSSMDPKRDTLRGGTRSYMAPEIIRGQKGEFRSDLYSLGVTLYYALCGVLPWGPRSKEDPPPTEEDFRPPDPHRLNEDVPLELSRFTMALLRQVSDVDYADAGEALQALAADAGQIQTRSVGQMANSLDVSAAPVIQGYFERGILSRRVEEDDLIREWISMASEPSTGRMYLIHGDDGVGKTRLLEDVQASVKLDGYLVLSHSCDELEGPYSLLLQMAQRLVELARSHEMAIPHRIETALQMRRLFTELDVITPGQQGSPMAEQSWIREAIGEILDRLSERKVIFFVDDIHRADAPSREVLYEWFRPEKSPNRPDVVATTGDGEFFETCADQQGVQVLSIEGIGQEDVESFFRGQLGLDELSDQWLSAVAKASQGRPAYIEELCRYLIDDGMLWRDSATRWKVRSEALEGAGVPESLRESLRRRITAVGAAGRECLELLALMQRPLTWKSARTLLERGGSDTQEAEETLETVQWRHLVQTILSQGGRYVQVVHRDLAEAVADMISPEWRRALHRRIGQQLARDWSDGTEDALEAAAHLDEGGELKRAAPYYELAGDWAMCQGKHRDAHHRYTRLLEGLERDEQPAATGFAHLKLARVTLERFDPELCRRHIEKAREAPAESLWLRYRVLLESAKAALSLGEVDVARGRIEQLHDELGQMGADIGVCRVEAQIHIVHGELQQADAALRRCISQEAALLPQRVVPAMGVWARLELLRGEEQEAFDSYARALTLLESNPSAAHRAVLLAWKGADLRRVGRPIQSRRTLRRALSILVETGPPDEVVDTLFQLAWTLAELDQRHEAFSRAYEALTLAEKLGHRTYLQKIALLLEGVRLRDDSDNEATLSRIDELVETFGGGDEFVAGRAELLMALGNLMIALQLKERGPQLLQRGRQIAFNIGATGLLPPVED